MACKCAFARDDQKYIDMSCLMKHELEQLKEIIMGAQTQLTVEEMYKQFASEAKCHDDECIQKYLLARAKHKSDQRKIRRLYEGALKIDDKEIPDENESLSGYLIDRMGFQLNYNQNQNYYYQGYYCYDAFEDAMQEVGKLDDTCRALAPSLMLAFVDKYKKDVGSAGKKSHVSEYIMKPTHVHTHVKHGSGETPQHTQIKLGYVLNTCHKYSGGKHWVGMVLEVIGKKVTLKYFNSQRTTGPQRTELTCDHFEDCPAKYLHYIPQFDKWWDDVREVFVKGGYERPILCYNNFITQEDDYSCGYHAILFNYFCANSTDSMGVMSQKVQLEDDKNLDDFIKQFRKMVFDV